MSSNSDTARKKMSVLWLDDDCTTPSLTFDNADVRATTTCSRAAKLLESSSRPPDWIIVDLIVPQEGWGSGLLRQPGVDFLSHLKKTYANVGLCAYAGFVDSKKRTAALQAGAAEVFDKNQVSFTEVLAILQHRSAGAVKAGG